MLVRLLILLLVTALVAGCAERRYTPLPQAEANDRTHATLAKCEYEAELALPTRGPFPKIGTVLQRRNLVEACMKAQGFKAD